MLSPHCTCTDILDSVVFVHGLGSNPDTTWKARTNHQQSNSQASNEYVCWVTDFLPDDISSTERENVRLFFYNYDSYWQRDAVQKRLHGLGKEMLHELQEIRKDWRVSRIVLLMKCQLISLSKERERYLVSEHGFLPCPWGARSAQS
jgi:hypothetical protein